MGPPILGHGFLWFVGMPQVPGTLLVVNQGMITSMAFNGLPIVPGGKEKKVAIEYFFYEQRASLGGPPSHQDSGVNFCV